LFQNHEIYKIALTHPIYTSFTIYVGLFFLALLTLRKGTKDIFLNRSVSEQVRGIAILFVVIGHIGVHTLVSKRDFLVLGEYGVSLFFILSGFGLTLSCHSKKITFISFLKRRVSKVMIPYVLITCIILLLDFIFLHRTYASKDILLTMIGVNINTITRHIDYVRWYVTLLLIWYVFFALLWDKLDGYKFPAAFTAIAFLLFLISYYVYDLGYAFFSFPCGIWLALYHEQVSKLLAQYRTNTIKIYSIICIVCIYLFVQKILPVLSSYVPSIFISLSREMMWILFSLAILLFVNALSPFSSGFLKYAGKYSYAIFLLHGPLMIKYDFILFKETLLVSFWLYLLCILTISMLMQNFIFNKVQQ